MVPRSYRTLLTQLQWTECLPLGREVPSTVLRILLNYIQSVEKFGHRAQPIATTINKRKPQLDRLGPFIYQRGILPSIVTIYAKSIYRGCWNKDRYPSKKGSISRTVSLHVIISHKIPGSTRDPGKVLPRVRDCGPSAYHRRTRESTSPEFNRIGCASPVEMVPSVRSECCSKFFSFEKMPEAPEDRYPTSEFSKWRGRGRRDVCEAPKADLYSEAWYVISWFYDSCIMPV